MPEKKFPWMPSQKKDSSGFKKTQTTTVGKLFLELKRTTIILARWSKPIKHTSPHAPMPRLTGGKPNDVGSTGGKILSTTETFCYLGMCGLGGLPA
jgi:hypothetical protein